MLKIVLVLMLLATSATSQTSMPTGSISGLVREDGTGSPIEGAKVWIQISGSDFVTATTDAQGRYILRSLVPGSYRIGAQTPQVFVTTENTTRIMGGISASRDVVLTPGLDLQSIDIRIQADLTIVSGRVLDEDNAPMAGLLVWLVMKQYQPGGLRYFFQGRARTDARGEYAIYAQQPERGYLVLGAQPNPPANAISDAAADAESRKPVLTPTYFPGAISAEAAELLLLRPGERREGVDIRMKKSASYCVDGTLEAAGAPAALEFEISEEQPSYGASSYSTSSAPNPKSGLDGKIRICDLHSGRYRLIVSASSGSPSLSGTAIINIADRDVHGIRVSAEPRGTLSGRVVWDGAPPDKSIESPATIRLVPPTEMGGASVRASVSGEFSYPSLSADDYAVRVPGLARGSYIKDITYGGASILYETFRFGGTAGGAELRVIVARDGGFANVKVVDKDGNAIAGTRVYLMPAGVASEAVLSALLVAGKTGLDGNYYSSTLRPGKYYVLATETKIFPTPESIRKLQRARTTAKEVEIGAGATVQLTLGLVGLE